MRSLVVPSPRFLGSLLLACVAVLVWPLRVARASDPEWTLSVSVTTIESSTVESVSLETIWLGQPKTIDLSPQDQPDGTRIWRGALTGPPIRMIPVSLWSRRSTDPAPRRNYFALEPLTYGDQALHYTVDVHRSSFLHRVAAEGTAQSTGRQDAQLQALSFAWGLLVILVVLAATQYPPRHRPVPQTQTQTQTQTQMWMRWEPLIWLLLALAWTWPAARAGGDQLVGRHFDALGTVWFLDAVPRLWNGLSDSLTAWPTGASYPLADSYLLMLWGQLTSWMDPVRAHGWLQVLGVASSAWGASAFAREVGARPPWTLMAGLGFGFSGMAANVLLEGHVYQVVNPWMPLFALMWWRTTGPRGTAIHGLMAGVFFVLTHLTTAYLGLAAALLAVGFFVDGLLRRGRAVLRPAATALVVVVPALAAWSWMIVQADRVQTTATRLQLGTLNLIHMSGASPETDLFGHSLALCLAGVSVALTLLARKALQPDDRWPVLVAVSLAAMALSAGPSFSDGASPGLPSPGAWIWSTDGLDRIRFPVRLIWASILGFSVLGARVASTLFPTRSRWGWLVLGLAIAEPFLLVRLPMRQSARLASVPSVYAESSGPVLDLLPTVVGKGNDLDSWLNSIACLYQTSHGRAIAEDCVRVPISPLEDRKLGREVAAHLLDRRAEAARTRLLEDGFATLAVHPDWLFPKDWQRLQPALSQLDPNPTEGRDGGDRVILYDLQAPPPVADASTAPLHQPLDRLLLQVVTSHLPAKKTTWRAQIVRDGEEDQSFAMVDTGSKAGDKPWDGIHTASLSGQVRSNDTLELYESIDGREELRWSGPLRSHGDDWRVFYQESDGSVVPILFSPDEAPPRNTPLRARIARLGWAVWAALACIAVLGVRLERTRRRRLM